MSIERRWYTVWVPQIGRERRERGKTSEELIASLGYRLALLLNQGDEGSFRFKIAQLVFRDKSGC